MSYVEYYRKRFQKEDLRAREAASWTAATIHRTLAAHYAHRIITLLMVKEGESAKGGHANAARRTHGDIAKRR
jgi:hypothetical protein